MATTWTDYRGRKWPVCSCLKAWLPVYQAELIRVGVIKYGLDVYQAIGNAPASAGYHKGGGNVDTGQTSTKAMEIARQMGGAGSARGPADGMTPHAHITLKGCPHMTYGPRWQVTELEAERNGLANRGRDRGPRSGIKWPLRSYKAGIAWAKARQKPKPNPFTIRAMTYNLPGADKIPNAASRAKAGAKLALTGDPDIIGWNELVGIPKAGFASDFAHDVDAALGGTWYLVKPTTRLNENYISYQGATLGLVKQHPDYVLTSASGGRHLTVAAFKHRATGRVLIWGQTHLVDTPSGASLATKARRALDRQSQARKAATHLKSIAADYDNCPIILAGDMNTPKSLLGALAKGLANVRPRAKATTNRNMATYTNIAKTKPSTNTDWIIDQILCDKTATVNGYTVIAGTNNKGEFTKPRASDHVPVLASITFP